MYAIQQFKLSWLAQLLLTIRTLLGFGYPKNPSDIGYSANDPAVEYFTRLWYNDIDRDMVNFPPLNSIGLTWDPIGAKEFQLIYAGSKRAPRNSMTRHALCPQPWSLGFAWVIGITVENETRWVAMARLRDSGMWGVVALFGKHQARVPQGELTVADIASWLRPDTTYADLVRDRQRLNTMLANTRDQLAKPCFPQTTLRADPRPTVAPTHVPLRAPSMQSQPQQRVIQQSTNSHRVGGGSMLGGAAIGAAAVLGTELLMDEFPNVGRDIVDGVKEFGQDVSQTFDDVVDAGSQALAPVIDDVEQFAEPVVQEVEQTFNQVEQVADNVWGRVVEAVEPDQPSYDPPDDSSYSNDDN